MPVPTLLGVSVHFCPPASYDLCGHDPLCAVRLRKGTTEADEELLRSALSRAAELGLSASAEVAAAQRMMERIKQEQSHVAALRLALRHGGVVIKLHDSVPPSTPTAPALLVETAELQKAVEEARAFDVKTRQARLLEQGASLLLSLRDALRRKVIDLTTCDACPQVEHIIEQLESLPTELCQEEIAWVK